MGKPSENKQKNKKGRPRKKPMTIQEKHYAHAETAIIPYIDYLTDPRKLEVAKILAYSGYDRDTSRSSGGAITMSARKVGVNRMTIYAWLECEMMQTAIQEIKAELCALALDGMRQLVKEKNFGACAFLLERLQPHQFSQQYLRMEHEKYMFDLEEKAKVNGLESQTAPTIIIEAPQHTKDYDRNKLD